MYGIRSAAQEWAAEVKRHMMEMNFKPVVSSPKTFYNGERGIMTLVHGDDFFSSGPVDQFDIMTKELMSSLIARATIIGPGQGHERQGRKLNILLKRVPGRGVCYDAYPRNVKKTVDATGIDQSKTLSTPGVNVYVKDGVYVEWSEEDEQAEDQESKARDLHHRKTKRLLTKSVGDRGGKLDEEGVRAYRRITARAHDLAPDRPDIGFTVKDLARKMSDPDALDWQMLCRLAIYLAGKPRMKLWYEHQPEQ